MKHIAENQGFTIVELLATMVISSLVVAFVFSMYLFAERLMGNWEKRTDLESLVDGCEARIAKDIMTCDRVDKLTDSLLVLEMNPIDTVKYIFANANVSRNGVLFAAGDERLEAYVLRIEDTSASVDQPVRLWSVRVLGQNSEFRDSSAVRLSTAIPSDELVNEEMKSSAAGSR